MGGWLRELLQIHIHIQLLAREQAQPLRGRLPDSSRFRWFWGSSWMKAW